MRRSYFKTFVSLIFFLGSFGAQASPVNQGICNNQAQRESKTARKTDIKKRLVQLLSTDAVRQTNRTKNISFLKADGPRKPEQYVLLESLYRISKKAEEIGGKAKTVFYPLCGFDTFTAATLFPDATIFIGLDNHPFSAIKQIQAKPYFGRKFENTVAVSQASEDNSEYVEKIFGGLLGAFPELRILDVQEFQHNIEDSSGLVEFDTGEGTPKRYYVHICTWVHNRDLEINKKWWFRLLDQLPIDRVVVKAPMSTFSSFGHSEGSFGYAHYNGSIFFRDKIEEWLLRTNGLTVFGRDQQGIHPPDFTSGQNILTYPKETRISGVSYSYGDEVGIFQYEGLNDRKAKN
ncbi:MAG: hypothetical protein AB7F43_11425 [Bacteriovoracia bacterium]